MKTIVVVLMAFYLPQAFAATGGCSDMSMVGDAPINISALGQVSNGPNNIVSKMYSYKDSGSQVISSSPMGKVIVTKDNGKAVEINNGNQRYVLSYDGPNCSVKSIYNLKKGAPDHLVADAKMCDDLASQMKNFKTCTRQCDSNFNSNLASIIEKSGGDMSDAEKAEKQIGIEFPSGGVVYQASLYMYKCLEAPMNHFSEKIPHPANDDSDQRKPVLAIPEKQGD